MLSLLCIHEAITCHGLFEPIGPLDDMTVYRVLNIVFFPKILKYSRLSAFSVFPQCQCEYTHQAGTTPALQQNWQSSEKSQNFKEKTQYLKNTL